MPELPEVESIRQMLLNRIIDRKIIGTETHLSRIIKRGDLDELTGRSFSEIRRLGKFLAFSTDSHIKLYTHFRMTGTFLWKKAGDEEPSHVRARLFFDDGELLFRDIRTLGGLWISNDDSVPWKKMGPDPFDDDCNTENLMKALSKRRIPVKAALLDQSVIAGIGNIYASEALYAAGVDPTKRSDQLGETELQKIIESVREIMTASIESGGTTFRDFKLSDGRDGDFKAFLKVYGKVNDTCSKCGTIIKRIVQNQRSTYYCPKCQK